MEFVGKTIWITGASSGIGKELAIQLSKFNTKLILSARNLSALEEVKKTCELSNANVAIVALDLEATETLADKASEALTVFDGIDILVNNGGISQRSLAKDTQLFVD